MSQTNLIPDKFIDYLVEQPETGGGYHICTIYMKNGNKRKGVFIYNCSQMDCLLDPTQIERIEVE